MKGAGKGVRVLVVDDEPLSRERLAHLLSRRNEVAEVGFGGDGEEALGMLCETPGWDLLFLDVQMPGLSGFEVLAALPEEQMPQVVFVTAHDQYALQAFEVSAADYLLKPFSPERFDRAFDRALRSARGLAKDTLQRLDPKPLQRLLYKGAGRIVLLPVEEVDYFEAAGNYVRVHVGKDRYEVRHTLRELEERLDRNLFCRIHRGILVRVARIREIQPWFHGDCVAILLDGTKLTVSRVYRRRLLEQIQ